MKRFVLALVAATLIAPAATAQVHVKGYTKKDGTYVAPHYRSSPNNSVYDNYSAKGNVNPYTGKVGTVAPYSTTNTYKSPYTPTTMPPPCYFNCPNK